MKKLLIFLVPFIVIAGLISELLQLFFPTEYRINTRHER